MPPHFHPEQAWHNRKLMAIAVLGLGLAALIAAIYQYSREPFELKVVSAEPSGSLDDAGKECLLVELQIANRGIGVLSCKKEDKWVEARIGTHWVQAENLWGIGILFEHDKTPITLLLPAATDTCRISFQYQQEPMQISLFRRLGARHERTAARIFPKRLYNWLSPNNIPFNPSGWKAVNLEVPLPKSYVRRAATSGKVHERVAH
jgi:hypothetical protein